MFPPEPQVTTVLPTNRTSLPDVAKGDFKARRQVTPPSKLFTTVEVPAAVGVPTA